MDSFGVLVENYGIRTGKSAPMAALKSSTRNQNPKSGNSSKPTHNSSYFPDSDWSDDPFGFSYDQKPNNSGGFDVFDDVINFPTSNIRKGAGLDFPSTLNSDSSTREGPDTSSDLLGGFRSGFSGSNSTSQSVGDDLLSSTPRASDPVDDFFGNFRNVDSDIGSSGGDSGLGRDKKNVVDADDLLPGFGTSTFADNGTNDFSKPSSGFEDDVDLLGTFSKPAPPSMSDNYEAAQKPQYKDFLDMTDMPTSVSNNQNHAGVDLDSFFGVHTTKKTNPSKPVEATKATKKSDLVPDLFSRPAKATEATKKSDPVPDLFGGTSSGTLKDFSSTSSADDLFSFGGLSVTEEFEEIEGESEDRRRARWDRFQRTKARMQQALADMNQRDFEAQQEQEEKRRIAEAMDSRMKRWAAGKEGNLRALLSALQEVLWPECGWRPVSLTDLITSSQVKLVYKKATLCVHPDKVQAKGANTEQKYIAEKIFDLLKEAWNKFNKEELR